MAQPITTLEQAAEWVGRLVQTRERTIDQLRSQDRTLDDVFALAQHDDFVARIAVLKLYEAVPGNGKVRSRRALARAGIADNALTKDVTAAQRSRVVDLLAKPLPREES